MTRAAGYYRFPTISGDTIAFVSEDDIWTVPISGGTARRLTATQGECSFPRFSPDGKSLAYVAREEGHPEVYVMPARGGPPQRLTFLGSLQLAVHGWSDNGKTILFTSDAGSAFFRHTEAFAVDAEGGMAQPLNLGHAVSISIEKNGAVVLGRNNNDPARWKRYRGGTAGDLWVDARGTGTFKRLLSLKGNLASPMWLNGRIYFLSDHEGVGNIYSCSPDGKDLRRHTNHSEYYVRYPSTDGKRIVYTCGADLWVFDATKESTRQIDVTVGAAPRQPVRRFVHAGWNLHHYAINPKGHALGLISRGQPFTMPLWEEAVLQHGAGSKARYRSLEWLRDGERFVVVNDLSQYERLELHHADQSVKPKFITDQDIGRVVDLVVSPVANLVALSNHKHELLLIDTDRKTVRVVDRSPADRITGISWSPDGRWLAYSYSPYPNTTNIRVADTKTFKLNDVTRPIRFDWSTSWDPEGKYLYFLSARDFNPIYDTMQFDLSFPYGTRPYLLTLRADVPSPFVPIPKPFVDTATAAANAGNNVANTASKNSDADSKKTKSKKQKTKNATKRESDSAESKVKPVEIDFNGIEDRILAFPVDEGRYDKIIGINGRAIFTRFPLRVLTRHFTWWNDEAPAGDLIAYDFKEQKSGVLQNNVLHFTVARDNRTLVYYNKQRLRVMDAGMAIPDAPQSGSDEPGRKSGWIDLQRVNVMIEPYAEWQQMFHETWRLQREHFWDEEMSGVDWNLVYKRYSALLPRVNARSELSDLIWEMQGELGTSHAYEMGGDYYRWGLGHYPGFLGADLAFDSKSGGYKITDIIRGDSWERGADSPLARPGLGVAEGDIIIAVGGRATSRTCSVDELLLNTAEKDVMLTIVDSKTKEQRRVAVKTLRDETYLRYRNWVETNRAYVHKKTNGRIGYLHIPDMGAVGFAEFHRNYLSEIHREGLIVDVRYNRGGHVSPLLLEKLARKRVGYDVSRWGVPIPYPPESVAGPLVAITNQFAGSDGDIFSHCFKLYKLGPLVGKRTWGGVIGIWPRHALVDGTITTQPEFSFWFKDAGWGVENYGTDPDYDIDVTPQDYRDGNDPQMDKALALIQQELKKNPFRLPNFEERPSLALPSAKKPAPRR